MYNIKKVLSQVQDVTGAGEGDHGHAKGFFLALRTLSRIRGWSTRVTGRKETLLIEKG
jgi:hypothetical protein